MVRAREYRELRVVQVLLTVVHRLHQAHAFLVHGRLLFRPCFQLHFDGAFAPPDPRQSEPAKTPGRGCSRPE